MDEAIHEKMDKILKTLSKKKDGSVEASLKYIIKQQKMQLLIHSYVTGKPTEA